MKVKEKNYKLNCKINIDKLISISYNKGDETTIEIFTIKEYNLYKEKYGNYKQNFLNDNKEEYQLIQVNNPHDKICRKALDKKKDAVKIINRILNEGEKISESEIIQCHTEY